jgi:hypothetical protein
MLMWFIFPLHVSIPTGSSSPFMTLAIDGEWSISCPAALPPEEEPPVPIGWMGPRAGLDAVE